MDGAGLQQLALDFAGALDDPLMVQFLERPQQHLDKHHRRRHGVDAAYLLVGLGHFAVTHAATLYDRVAVSLYSR